MSRIADALRKVKTQNEHRPPSAGRQEDSAKVEKRAGRRFDDTPPDIALPSVPASQSFHADELELAEERVIASSEIDERVGPYRKLRTRLLKTMRDNGWNTLAITSAHESAGKSLTAANLAISLAKDVRTTVLLVDLDLETPTIHKKLMIKADKGVVDFLEERATLEEILYSPGFDGLAVMAGRSATKQSSELLASPRMQQLMHDLSHQSEANITIFDLPPLRRNDDAILFAPFADATLIIVEDGVTTERQFNHALSLLDKANVIGTILNKARSA